MLIFLWLARSGARPDGTVTPVVTATGTVTLTVELIGSVTVTATTGVQ